jgi:hypothetical protein
MRLLGLALAGVLALHSIGGLAPSSAPVPGVSATGVARAETAAKTIRPATGMTTVRIPASMRKGRPARTMPAAGNIVKKGVAGSILTLPFSGEATRGL